MKLEYKTFANNADHHQAIQEWLYLKGYEWIFMNHQQIHFLADVKEHLVEPYGYVDLSHLDLHLKPKGDPMNSLALLRQAQEHLREAENAYENATFELEKAKEGHRVALEAFKEEAKGIIGDSEETPEEAPQGITSDDMSDPRDWLPGDIVECSNDPIFYIKERHIIHGKYYELADVYCYDKGKIFLRIDGIGGLSPYDFKWISRPVK